jgi:hypothetical protein
MTPEITNEEVHTVLYKTGQWKAAGRDQLPNGFLRTYGPPLVTALRQLATSSTVLGYFPAAFKKATVVVLRKPGKLTV